MRTKKILLNILKYSGILLLAIIITAPIVAYFLLSIIFNQPSSAVDTDRLNRFFQVNLPPYTIDSIWRRESFTGDITEKQVLLFDSMEQKQWQRFMEELRLGIKDTANVNQTIERRSNPINIKQGRFEGGYQLYYLYENDISYGGERIILTIDTVLYRGFLDYSLY